MCTAALPIACLSANRARQKHWPSTVSLIRQKLPSIPINSFKKNFLIKATHHRLMCGPRTKIMGILNLTPDSFSRDGCLKYGFLDSEYNLSRALQLVDEGADIVDIGGESTRPGAKRIDPKEEIRRIIPTLRKIAKKIKIPISVDTYKPEVAKEALAQGASIVNNIMGTKLDKELLKIVKNYKAAIVLMHSRGIPKIKQYKIYYKDLIAEIMTSLQNSIEICLAFGIESDRIIIDPGIGFGKTWQHNLGIIHRLDEFKALNQPILIGTSRKSFIGKILNKEVEERLTGSLACVSASVLKGADIVRVHDVKETKQTIKALEAIIGLFPSFR